MAGQESWTLPYCQEVRHSEAVLRDQEPDMTCACLTVPDVAGGAEAHANCLDDQVDRHYTLASLRYIQDVNAGSQVDVMIA